MLPEFFGLLLALAVNGAPAMGQLGARLDEASSALASLSAAIDDLSPKASFRPAERAVTNWRVEAAGNLDLAANAATKLASGANPPAVARCVKLNNYWCIKRAGWAGEIAADAEGHVAFASAVEGAVVAAVLLRRYYVDYHRRSALAILTRWAPAQCSTAESAGARRKRAPTVGLVSPTLRALAVHGIANTLRARWLAAHRPGLAAAKTAAAAAPVRRSAVADRPAVMMRAPEIAVGMGEVELSRAPIRIAALEPTLPAAPVASPACPNEIQRIHNYALRAIEGIVSDPDEDLKLFSPDGAPGVNLARLMRNMARVEIGPLGAREELIAAAVEIAAQRNEAVRAVAGAGQ